MKFKMLGWECIGLLAWFRRHGRGSHPSNGPWRELCFMELEEGNN